MHAIQVSITHVKSLCPYPTYMQINEKTSSATSFTHARLISLTAIDLSLASHVTTY